MADNDQDTSQDLQQQVEQAFANQAPLVIQGGGSKSFLYQHEGFEDTLDISDHSGIINYEPTELLLTARAGTPLTDIEALLAQHQQMPGFEPPGFSGSATIGGTIACNLSGPRRPFAGAARDFTLGCKIINGRGEVLQFGGQVMKNVAGYDVSRLMAGAFGTLGVLLEISIRVLPLPEKETTIVLNMDTQEAIKTCTRLRRQASLVSAACYIDKNLFIRFSGNAMAVKQVVQQTGGEYLNEADTFWHSIKEQQHAFFQSQKPLWRLSVPPATPALTLDDEYLLDWGGGLYWVYSDMPAEQINKIAQQAKGHASVFRNSEHRFNPLSVLDPFMLNLHQRLKQAFDPAFILNPDLCEKRL